MEKALYFFLGLAVGVPLGQQLKHIVLSWRRP